MKKNQVADLSTIAKSKIDNPSADTKKKEEIKKKQKAGLISQEMANQQLSSQKSQSDQDALISGSPPAQPGKLLQNQQSQDTSNLTNPPQQPPKQKKKLKGILVPDEQNKKNVKVVAVTQNEDRKDHFGVLISKGPNKHHRIYFNPQIQEVYEVENWKEYNLEEKYGLCSCRCNIFQMTLLTILAM